MTEIPSSRLKGSLISRQPGEVVPDRPNLKGSLVHNHRPTEQSPETPQLKGHLAARIGETAASSTGISRPLLESECIPTREHSPTWDLEFGNYGTGLGDIDTDGFEARNSNHSNSQDAFAINLNAGRFAVADGLGGAGADKDGTRFLAKFISDYAVTHGIDRLFDEDAIQDIYEQAHEEFRSVYGRNMEPPKLLGRLNTTAATTLTYTELLPGNRARIVTVGDSPAFITDSSYIPLHQFGEDAQSGSTDGVMGFSFRMKANGTRETAPRKDETVRGLSIEEQIIEYTDDTRIIIGSDYFSEAVSVYYQPLADYIGKSASEYHDSTRTSGKPDDATIIVINPSVLTTHSPRR